MFLHRRPVQSRVVAVQEISKMADRRDWGGGGDDLEESTQRIIERIWESLTDIRMRMDQQAPVPPVAVPPGDGETVPIVPVPPPPGAEEPFVAPLPPPVLAVEEPVMQVEKFLRLHPPTYSGGPNPDIAEHWVHEIERVFATMRCPVDKVVLAAYQLRGFALEWWRLKMQTTFAGRTEEAITWSEFLDVFNDTFFPIQVQQVKREKFRTLQQGLCLCELLTSSSLSRRRSGRGGRVAVDASGRGPPRTTEGSPTDRMSSSDVKDDPVLACASCWACRCYSRCFFNTWFFKIS
ncbi:hypothetical protein Taro_000968 [Colocasia esculenta]|uniref:Retrotransposon gag domain-containing protein n=1 Tax=Colocasia esculenta TaxID=4460 RepID=A0A843TEL6_COLES|nr:hypothetical protein [Colocasia esculenta]